MRHLAALSAILILFAVPPAPAPASAPPDDARMAWWREARFGLFIHWGLYAVPAGAWGSGTDHGEWIRTTAQIPLETYARFADAFDPQAFDADLWCEMAKAAGMKYIVITTKHHDGFALFDSAVSDFDIMATPFQRDIMAELAEACRRHGLKICWYHSIMDWNHPDYLPRRSWEADRPSDGADDDRFVEFLHAQVTELLTKYGDIGVMWFDGEWESTWTTERGKALYDLCLRLQPNVIVNNRVDVGRQGMAGFSPEGFAGDFGTPEQEVPHAGLPGVDWETCMTMNRHWGWNERDRTWKSTSELVRLLVDVASKGGNFLLNVGPRADGTFPPQAARRLSEIGQWMSVHGESIHGTTASPLPPLAFGRATMRQGNDTSTLYVHVFDWPADATLVVPGLASRVTSARLLSDANRALEFAQSPRDLSIALPHLMPDERCSVIALEIEGTVRVHLPPRIVSVLDVEGDVASPVQFVSSLTVRFEHDSPGVVRYTMDGQEPNPQSPEAPREIYLGASFRVRAALFVDDQIVSDTVVREFEKVLPRAGVVPGPTAPGLREEHQLGTFDRLPDFSRIDFAGIVRSFGLSSAITREHIAVRQRGVLTVPESTLYRFRLTSDDGSRLLIGGQVIIDNDGLHAEQARIGHVALERGRHEIIVEWFNRTGGAALQLEWARGADEFRPIDPALLSHTP